MDIANASAEVLHRAKKQLQVVVEMAIRCGDEDGMREANSRELADVIGELWRRSHPTSPPPPIPQPEHSKERRN